jgi:hypothetical protein
MNAISIRGKHYQIDQRAVRYPCASLKVTRTQAGAMFTIARRGTSQNPAPGSDATRLALYGTLDPLARTNCMKRHRATAYRAESVTRWIKK